MKVQLTSTNHNVKHAELTFVTREKEIIILCGDREVANLTVETMESDFEPGQMPQPTENFWLRFRASESSTAREFADVWIKKPE